MKLFSLLMTGRRCGNCSVEGRTNPVLGAKGKFK
jgi:hypothetical protein